MDRAQRVCLALALVPAVACYQSVVTGGDAGAPSDAPAATAVAGLSAGDDHSCLLLTTGRVVCWGHLRAAEAWPEELVGAALFDGSCVSLRGGGSDCGGAAGPTNYALQERSLRDASGSERLCVVDEAGTLNCRPTSMDAFEEAARNVRAVATGRAHVCILAGDGRVLCQGENLAGQCGQPPSERVEDFAEVPGLGAVQGLAAGAEHTCVLVSGRVNCWGRRAEGELGDDRLDLPANCGRAPSLFACTHEPREALGIRDALEVTAGQFHTCVRRETGEVRCFGSDAFERLGLAGDAPSVCGEAPCSGRPLPVEGVTNAEFVSAGRFHTCAASAREVRCWGSGAGAQLVERFLELDELVARLGL